jgi:hypothetical protein
VGTTESAPLSWRLPAVAALKRCGITVSAVGADEVRRRVRWLLGTGPEPLDPRLADRPRGSVGSDPGALRDEAVALAIRDLADERLAFTVTLGSESLSGADSERVAAILGDLEDSAGRPAAPLSVSVGGDDAGALSQYLLQRATLEGEVRAFQDPQQRRPVHPARSFPILRLFEQSAALAVPEALSQPGRFGSLADGPVTACRVSFGADGFSCALFESSGPPAVARSGISVPLPAAAEEFVRRWPADRLTLVPGRHAERLVRLLRDSGFQAVSLAAAGTRTFATVPPPSGA